MPQPPASETATPTATLDQILGALGKVSEQLGAIESRLTSVEGDVARQKQRTVKFQPMQAPEGVTPPVPDIRKLQQAGDQTDGGKTIATTPQGNRVTGMYQRQFVDGSVVRINPTSDLADRLRRKGTDVDHLEGVVLGIHYITRTLQPKYRVLFPSITRNTGDGFYEDELVTA